MAKKPPKPPARKGKGRKRHAASAANSLPPVTVIEILGTDGDGELLAAPAKWDSRRAPPHISLNARSKGSPKPGDRVLARLEANGKHSYRATPITILPKDEAKEILGVLENGVLYPAERRDKETYRIAEEHRNNAENGELVLAETLPGRVQGGIRAKVVECLGAPSSARAASTIAIHKNHLPTRFTEAALAEAAAAAPPVEDPMREDLRAIHLVTIDGEDARDFDDAVFAERDGAGWHLLVAIADVAHYVKPETTLDAAAFERGNSAYFPDRVIPMLPETLSNGLCSLKPEEDRYCLAAHLWIDAEGNVIRHRFVRGLMRSHARLTYTEVQAMMDSGTPPPHIQALYAAYAALAKARDGRGALDIDMPEFVVKLDNAGNVASLSPRTRLESHRLIEAFMVTANVAAAEFLLERKLPGVYRVHPAPEDEKCEALRDMLRHLGYRLPRGANTPDSFNRVLTRAHGTAEEYVVQQAVLRAQMQAFYAPKNTGHFGLSLKKYSHFTSPIRRYADLMVHRSISAALMQVDPPSRDGWGEACTHISTTERTAMQAERDAMDRYRAAFMENKIGETHPGIITGLVGAGLFVTLLDLGVTGFVPVHTLGNDYFIHHPHAHAFEGQRTRRRYAMGDRLDITVTEASALTGNLAFAPHLTAQRLPPKKKIAVEKSTAKPKRRKRKPHAPR